MTLCYPARRSSGLQPFAVGCLGDAADIAGDRAVEARVEAGLGAIEKRVEARKAAIGGAVAILGFEKGRGQRGAKDERAGHGKGHSRKEEDRKSTWLN